MGEGHLKLDKEIHLKDKDFVTVFYELCFLCTGLSARDAGEGHLKLDKEIHFKDRDFVTVFYEFCFLCTGLSARDAGEGVGA